MSTIKHKDYVKELFKNITEDSDLLYIALTVLTIFGHRTAYTDIADMSLILDTDSFLNLIDVYGGKTITIPTKEELLRICNTVMMFYETEINGLSTRAASQKYGISNDRLIHYDLAKFKNALSTLKVPGTTIK